MTEKVLYQQDGQIVTITLNDPAMRNPISERETVDGIVAALERLNQDRTARVAILTGAGTAFSSGGDLRAMQKRSGRPNSDRSISGKSA
jgi:enoyl-CoA hydratase/carnithine racemase